MESKVGITAAAHFTGGKMNITKADLDASSLLAEDPVQGPDEGGTSCRLVMVTSHGRTASGCSTPSDMADQSRLSGRTPAWTDWSVPRRRSRLSRSLPLNRQRRRSTPHSLRDRARSDLRIAPPMGAADGPDRAARRTGRNDPSLSRLCHGHTASCQPASSPSSAREGVPLAEPRAVRQWTRPRDGASPGRICPYASPVAFTGTGGLYEHPPVLRALAPGVLAPAQRETFWRCRHEKDYAETRLSLLP